MALALLVDARQESPIDLENVATVQHSSQHESQQYMTQIGEHSNVVLTDGSKLKLNTNTHITVTYTDKKRNIELHKGEVFCEVAKNPQRPFVVVAGDNTVSEIGTAFNMQIDLTQELEVLVTEGKVKIDTRRGAFDILSDLSSDSTYLTVGEKALISDKKVIKEISRYTPLKLKVVDPEIRQIPVGSFYITANFDKWTKQLEKFGVSNLS